MAEVFDALGVRLEVEGASLGHIRIRNTPKRTLELVASLGSVLERGSLSVAAAQRLRGRLQFADSLESDFSTHRGHGAAPVE